MMKAIFLDLDGTLVANNDKISPKVKEAITTVRAKGHKVFICTGRAIKEVFEHILAIGFDGMICSNGTYIEIDGVPILHEQFKAAEIKDFDAFFKANNIVYTIETNEGIFANQAYFDHFDNILAKQLAEITDATERAQFQENIKRWLSIFTVTDDLIRADVNNVTFIGSTQQSVDDLFTAYQGRYEIYQNVVPIFGALSGELGINGITKGSSIAKVAKHLAIDIGDTIGIGDGTNDISMLNIVGTGIAMGNAPDIVKEAAAIVTTSVEDDGIYHAFKTLKLL